MAVCCKTVRDHGTAAGQGERAWRMPRTAGPTHGSHPPEVIHTQILYPQSPRATPFPQPPQGELLPSAAPGGRREGGPRPV